MDERFDGGERAKINVAKIIDSGTAADHWSAAMLIATVGIAREGIDSSEVQLERWWGIVECLRLMRTKDA